LIANWGLLIANCQLRTGEYAGTTMRIQAEEFSERLWEFASRIGNVVEALPDTRMGRHVAGQLVRCGTSSAPNYDEARAAESRDDFAHKISIATKEMRETFGWLGFIVRTGMLRKGRIAGLLDEAEQLLKMLSKSVLTAKRRADLTPRTPSGESAISNQQSPVSNVASFRGLDHLAIAVPDTEQALKLWRDTFGFPVLYSEDVNDGAVRLTHLDLGNAHLQLVQPLTPGHPLQAWLAKNGPGLHHFCLAVEDVAVAMKASPVSTAPKMHQGTQGKRALFLDKSATQGVQVELTGK
jgi:methylmalonyl-CoA/ethylmalonyl-CoA epimerase